MGDMQCVVDLGKHTVEISIHFVVPKPQHPKPLMCEMIIARAVPACIRIEIVLPTVNFDNESMPEAHEIDNEGIPRRLSTEVKAALPPRPQMHPKLDLLWGQPFAKFASHFVRHVIPHPDGLRPTTLPLRGRD